MIDINWPKTWALLGGWLLIVAIFAWIIFALTTMRKIDNAVLIAGKSRPCQWDPMWLRAMLYAWPVALPTKIFNHNDDRIVDSLIVKNTINLLDKIIAWILMITGYSFVICVIVGWIFNFY